MERARRRAWSCGLQQGVAADSRHGHRAADHRRPAQTSRCPCHVWDQPPRDCENRCGPRARAPNQTVPARSARSTRAGVNGACRRRTRTASKTALAIAAAVAMDEASPPAIGCMSRWLISTAVPVQIPDASRSEIDFFHQRAAEALNDVPLNLVAEPVRIDDDAAAVLKPKMLAV